MALKTILNQQTDFTGEFPAEWAKGGLWRMNESAPDENNHLLDSSGAERPAFINNWSGTTHDFLRPIFLHQLNITEEENDPHGIHNGGPEHF